MLEISSVPLAQTNTSGLESHRSSNTCALAWAICSTLPLSHAVGLTPSGFASSRTTSISASMTCWWSGAQKPLAYLRHSPWPWAVCSPRSSHLLSQRSLSSSWVGTGVRPLPRLRALSGSFSASSVVDGFAPLPLTLYSLEDSLKGISFLPGGVLVEGTPGRLGSGGSRRATGRASFLFTSC